MVAFAIAAATIALTGGSYRPDNVWLLVMRPVVILCLCALLLTTRPDWRSIRPLPLFLGLFALTIAIQLVPLPPALWLGAHGSEGVDAVVGALGGADRWHPLSLTPDRTWNSLLALLVPLTVMAGYASLDDIRRQALIWPLLGLVGISMLLGVLQIAGGSGSPFYWYPVSGRGQLIGLLANRNHQGTLLALALPLLRAWTLLPAAGRRTARVRRLAGGCAAATIVLYALVLGSRAGLALTLFGIVAAFLVEPRTGIGRLPPRQRWAILGGIALAIAALIALALSVDRAVAIDRMLGVKDIETEGRLAALPTLLHMVSQSLPFGTGYGSFVPIFANHEPDALLKPTYFNAAHNDLIELAITGGVMGIAVLAIFVFWLVRAAWRDFRMPDGDPIWRPLKRAAAFAMVILLLASLTDYPLRTPLLGAIFTLLCCWLANGRLGVSEKS
ncbi:O-antigen ligase family protein [Sphingomonas sanguinis]|uniref:O-antigen ligase family protein n=1 Tax=Sphingomonas sanguinis TaxID=33051 RepID=A0A7Y7USI8_9SPHN|nr:O-antigen ligase family protein [Sphingomonas sanguinis]NNG49689.1 O-antigen ligase family protein [Sphingomonas sanguinis]NNG52764.1 O-antigen ligase family protein [Sphingomonas sanguinis]NVP33059.1 O-antigen ligase family protein [Sphingomonas sanguinis]